MTRLDSVKRTVFRILDPDTRDTGMERAANLVLAGVIVLNVAAVVLETVQALREQYAGGRAPERESHDRRDSGR